MKFRIAMSFLWALIWGGFVALAINHAPYAPTEALLLAFVLSILSSGLAYSMVNIWRDKE